MEEINLKELFDYFVSKWFIIAIAGLIFVVAGVSYTVFLKTPMYNSYTTMVLTTNNEKTNANQTITQSDITLNKNLISNYRVIMKSHSILNQVINNLDLNMSTEQLKKQVNVTTEDDTEIIRISVSNENGEAARDIANEIARVFSNDVARYYSIKNVAIVDYAEASSNPYNISLLKTTVLALLVGVVLACATIFIMFYFDTTIKSVEEIESKIGLPTLGVVPLKYVPKEKKGRRK